MKIDAVGKNNEWHFRFYFSFNEFLIYSTCDDTANSEEK